MLRVTDHDIRDGESSRDYVRRIPLWRKAILFTLGVGGFIAVLAIPAIAFTASSFVSPLIPALCLAALFALGVFLSVKLEDRFPWGAMLAYRFALLTGFTAGMVIVGWALNDLVIPQLDNLAAIVGDKAMLAGIIAIGLACAVAGYVGHRRYN